MIDDVSFNVRDGESVGVIGPNGGGKSTLLKLFLGLESPMSGELKVLGEVAGKSRRRIGYVPQAMRFDPLYPCLLYTSPSPRDRTRSRMPSSA